MLVINIGKVTSGNQASCKEVGRHISKRLSEQGYNVLFMDMSNTSKKQFVGTLATAVDHVLASESKPILVLSTLFCQYQPDIFASLPGTGSFIYEFVDTVGIANVGNSIRKLESRQYGDTWKLIRLPMEMKATGADVNRLSHGNKCGITKFYRERCEFIEEHGLMQLVIDATEEGKIDQDLPGKGTMMDITGAVSSSPMANLANKTLYDRMVCAGGYHENYCRHYGGDDGCLMEMAQRPSNGGRPPSRWIPGYFCCDRFTDKEDPGLKLNSTMSMIFA